MKHYKGIFVVLSLLVISACASEQTRPDPIKEELTILQKQLLELQKLQNETKARLDESTENINVLSAKLQTLEARRTVRQSQIVSKPTTSQNKKTSPPKKKSKKKTKKIRRQE